MCYYNVLNMCNLLFIFISPQHISSPSLLSSPLLSSHHLTSPLLTQVDIFQMSILEFVDRPGSPLFHLEHFIEGEYIKYNSNSGFVDETFRQTPQVSFDDLSTLNFYLQHSTIIAFIYQLYLLPSTYFFIFQF